MTSITNPRALVPGRGLDLGAGLRSLIRGRAEDAVWIRPAAIGIGLLAAILYLWNLTVSGYANQYYSGAALAASQSWSAWFFGSVDPANFITVDKPPLATMLMGLSVRLFGLSSLSILLPQALLGVASVLLLFAVVRRAFGPVAAVIAGVVMALQPAAVLMFRYNNPDALLTFLFIAAAWALQRGLVDDRRRWLVLAGVLIGLAFNTKYLQAYLVLPAFALTYAVAGSGSVRRRIGGLLISLASVLVASSWWVAIVEVIPASARPYIGGSTNNSALDLIFGYDGLGRIFGAQGPGGGGGGGGFGGTAGLFRLFNSEFAGEISWLIPLTIAMIIGGLVVRSRTSRTDLGRAAYLMWGGWFLVTAAVFSFMTGIIHSYYSVALAPAIAAIVGGGISDLWRVRSHPLVARLLIGIGVVASAWWAMQVLGWTPDLAPGLGIVALVAAVAAAAAILLATLARNERLGVVAVGLAVAAVLAGPASYAVATMNNAYSGGDPAAGPSAALASRNSGAPGPGAGFSGQRPTPPEFGGTGTRQNGAFVPPTGSAGGVAGPGAGGLVDQSLLDYLVANKGEATWIVAVSSADRAGSIELATGEPVMAMGGFTGSDPAPTLEQLQAYVASGQLRFVIVEGNGVRGPGGDGGSTASISSWVTQTCTPVDTGSGTSTGLYDCAGTVSSNS